MEKPLLLLALMFVVIRSKKTAKKHAKGLFCVSSRRSWSLPAR